LTTSGISNIIPLTLQEIEMVETIKVVISGIVVVVVFGYVLAGWILGL
jgi:hypothetical protein